MDEGVVVRAYGGFYYVLPVDLQGVPVACRLRGRLKRSAGRILVGERVGYVPPPQPGTEGVIEEVRPRRVCLVRPAVVNVDQVVVVAAAACPPPDLLQVDRLLCLAGRLEVESVVCLNKVDLADPAGVDAALEPYRAARYPTAALSARTGAGVEKLRQLLVGKVSVLAGRSGVGKTALSNRLVPGRLAETGAVSTRLGQGRHTTRHAELLVLEGGGLLADTPGFSALEDQTVTPLEVAALYPEYDDLAEGCRFRGCLHDQEPGCAIKAAVEAESLSRERYERYLILLREARQHRPW